MWLYCLALKILLRLSSARSWILHDQPCGVIVVVQIYPWFKFSFLLFLGMVMYDNNMIMSLNQKKRKFEPRIKIEPQHHQMGHSLVLYMLCYIDIEVEHTVHHIFSKGCLKGALISGAPNNGFLLNALKGYLGYF